jgi:hypothetical protein
VALEVASDTGDAVTDSESPLPHGEIRDHCHGDGDSFLGIAVAFVS